MSGSALAAGRPGKSYDAFISYSHAADDRLAPQLQRGLQRFAKSWRQRRALDVFRDRTGLSVNPDLWAGITAALDHAEWFIYLASPAAAASEWVGREISRWLDTKDPGHVLVVLTDGEWRWDAARNQFDESGSSAIHPALVRAFTSEPLVLDLRWAHSSERLSLRDPRFRDAVAELAAPIHGRAKDDLEDDDTRTLRRTRRVAATGVALLAVLLVGALVAGWVALGQRDQARSQRLEAQKQRDAAEHQLLVSRARLIATTASSLVATNVGDAELLAAQAWAMHPDPQTRQALFEAVSASPHLVRYVDAGDTVTALASSRDGRTIVIGTGAGRVLVWRPDEDPMPRKLWTLSGSVVSVAAANDTPDQAGTDSPVVAATDGNQVVQSDWSGPIEAMDGYTVSALATSASGAVTAFAEGNDEGRTTVVTVKGGVPVTATGTELLSVPRAIAFYTTEELTTFDYLGGWANLVLSRRSGAFRVVEQGNVPQGAHNYAGVISPDGVLVGFTNGGPTVPLYFAGGSTEGDPDFVAASPARAPNSLAVDPTDQELAIADGGSIYLSPLVVRPSDAAVKDTLTGNAEIASGLVTFAGRFALTSATTRYVAEWHLHQLNRIANDYSASVPYGCSTCAGPAVQVSPDGSTVAVVPEGGEGWALDRLGTTEPVIDATDLGDDQPTAPPLWTKDGDRVVVPFPNRVEVLDSESGSRSAQWPIDLDAPVAAGLTHDGKDLVLVGADGRIETLDATDGHEVSSSEVRVGDSARVLLDAAHDALGVMSSTGVDMRTLSGDEVARLPLTGLQSPDLAGGRLTAVSATGAPTVWDVRSGTELWSAGQTGGVLAGPVLSPDGDRVAYQRRDGTVVVVDLSDGGELATFSLPSSVENQQAGLAFSADAKALYAALETDGRSPGEIQVWDLDPAHWSEVACASAGRALTDETLDALTRVSHLETKSCAYRP